MAGLQDVLGGFDCGADGGGVEWGDGAEAGFEEKLGSLRVGGFVVRCCGEDGGWGRVTDEDALAEVGAGDFAEFGGLGVGLGRGADDVEAGDASVEPEAGYVGRSAAGMWGSRSRRTRMLWRLAWWMRSSRSSRVP